MARKKDLDQIKEDSRYEVKTRLYGTQKNMFAREMERGYTQAEILRMALDKYFVEIGNNRY